MATSTGQEFMLDFVIRPAVQSPHLGNLQGPATKYNRKATGGHSEFLVSLHGIVLPSTQPMPTRSPSQCKGSYMLSKYFPQVPALCPDSSENPSAPIRVLVLLCGYLRGSAVLCLRGVHGLL